MKNNLEIMQSLEKIKMSFFTLPDLEKILDYPRESLYVIINRLVKKKILFKMSQGLYRLSSKPVKLENVATVIYFPSYLSFESALARYGMLNQIPYTISFATSRKSKKLVLEQREITFSHLKSELFYGFKKVEDVYIAQPEKALLDQLYMVSKGKATLDFEELNLKGLKKTLFLQYSKKFPKPTQKLARKLVKDFGKISITVK